MIHHSKFPFSYSLCNGVITIQTIRINRSVWLVFRSFSVLKVPFAAATVGSTLQNHYFRIAAEAVRSEYELKSSYRRMDFPPDRVGPLLVNW